MDTLKQLTERAEQLEGELRILKQAIENRSKAQQPDPAPWQVWEYPSGIEVLLIAEDEEGAWLYTEVASNGWGHLQPYHFAHLTYKRTIDPMRGIDDDMPIL